ncbi:putative transmembrane protein [Histomonas meleagridis]|uniref:putative transmembrane protein n=1 Tax=Histomonas meleagridis TaxID=135588 RepID=UPI00355AB52F|nr:putative transmembrane protein [Histomonas meleagridis]KAH0806193.1 putative transmembrane protein [Histomonas meleagridis]
MEAQSDFLIIVIPIIFIVIIYLIACRSKGGKSNMTNLENPTKFSRLPIVTITANNILLDENMKLTEQARSALVTLAKKASIFIFILVKDQEEVNRISDSMVQEFSGLVDKEQILYTQTEEGRASMSRQLEPAAHIDFDPEVVRLTSIFIPTAFIAPMSVESQYSKWHATSVGALINGNNEFINSLK